MIQKQFVKLWLCRLWASCVNINNQSQSRAPEEKTEPTKSRFLNLLLSSVLTVKAEMCIHLSKVAIHFQRWKHKWREPWDRQISCRKVKFENANLVHDAAIKTPFFVHFAFVQNNEALPLAIQNCHFLILIFWIICLSFSFLFCNFHNFFASLAFFTFLQLSLVSTVCSSVFLTLQVGLVMNYTNDAFDGWIICGKLNCKCDEN